MRYAYHYSTRPRPGVQYRRGRLYAGPLYCAFIRGVSGARQVANSVGKRTWVGLFQCVPTAPYLWSSHHHGYTSATNYSSYLSSYGAHHSKRGFLGRRSHAGSLRRVIRLRSARIRICRNSEGGTTSDSGYLSGACGLGSGINPGPRLYSYFRTPANSYGLLSTEGEPRPGACRCNHLYWTYSQ